MKRKNVMRSGLIILGAFVLWVGVGFASAQTACAHDPRFTCSPRAPQNPVRVPDAAKSWAYYGRLTPGESDTYTFDVPQRLGVPIQLLVESADAANPARPAVTVTDESGKPAVSIDFQRTETFHEPFSGLDYVTTPAQMYVLSPGHYIATVSMRGGSAPQRYVFAIGDAEKFGVGEIPYVLGAVYRVKTRGY